MGAKVGTFFLMLGAGLVMLFVISDRAGTPDYPMLLYGVACLAFGVLLKVRFRPAPPPPADRFGLFKKKAPSEQGAKSPGFRLFGKKKDGGKSGGQGGNSGGFQGNRQDGGGGRSGSALKGPPGRSQDGKSGGSYGKGR